MSESKVDLHVFEMMKVVLPELIRIYSPRIYADGAISLDLIRAAHRAAVAAVADCELPPARRAARQSCAHPFCDMVAITDSDFCLNHQG